jgi:hypothetical protein
MGTSSACGLGPGDGSRGRCRHKSWCGNDPPVISQISCKSNSDPLKYLWPIPPIYYDNGQGDPDFPEGDPPDLPFNDDPNFPDNNIFPDNDSDEEPEVEQVPMDTLTQLASAIQSLAHSSCHPTSDSAPRTKVREPDQFDRTNP